jgi:predicted N-acetyltransferase YhbS
MTIRHHEFDVAAFVRAVAPLPRPFGVVVAEMATDEATQAVGVIVERCRGDADAELRLPSARGLAGELSSRPGRSIRLWCARDGGEPVGFGSLHESRIADQPRLSIGWLVVTPGHRRRGVGLALVAAIVDAAQARQAATIHVEVHAGWAAAHGFWSRLATVIPATPARVHAAGMLPEQDFRGRDPSDGTAACRDAIRGDDNA